MITVDTYKMLKALPNHTEGEIAYVTKEEQKYQYTEENGWQVYKAPEVTTGMSLYDLNKQIISQLPNMEDFEEAKQIITDYHNNMSNKYYMLLFRELNYFTLFNINPYDEIELVFEDEVIECLKNLGNIKSITMCDSEGSVECWVTTADDNTVVGYLFGYDGGVIECQ